MSGRRPRFPKALRSLYDRFATFARRSDTGDSRLQGRAEAFDDHVQLGRLDNEGRGEEDVVAVHAVDRPAHRIDDESPLHRLPLDPRMEFRRGIERPLAGAIADQFERMEEPAPPYVADVAVIAETLLQAPVEPIAHR